MTQTSGTTVTPDISTSIDLSLMPDGGNIRGINVFQSPDKLSASTSLKPAGGNSSSELGGGCGGIGVRLSQILSSNAG